MQADEERLDPREECFRIAGPVEGLKLFLRRLRPISGSQALRVVLYVHGLSFPSALSIAHRMEGRSWRDELCDAGWDVWGLDFYGFGGSDRYREMNQPAEDNPPLGRLDLTSRQIEQAVRFIASRNGGCPVSLIGHSGGCLAAGLLATRCPELIDRMVFFAPIVRRPENDAAARRLGAWQVVTIKEQWDRFTGDVPTGETPVLPESDFAEWGEGYLDSDVESRNRAPAGVKTPCGLIQDVFDTWSGAALYEPAEIRAPVAIVRGEWDTWSSDSDTRSLFQALRSSPIRRVVTISRGTHVLHLEESRYALYRESITFLQGGDQRPRAAEPIYHCSFNPS